MSPHPEQQSKKSFASADSGNRYGENVFELLPFPSIDFSFCSFSRPGSFSRRPGHVPTASVYEDLLQSKSR